MMMGKNPDLSPKKRARIVGKQNQKLKLRILLMTWELVKLLANKLFIIGRNLATSIHHQSQAGQELPASDCTERFVDHQMSIE